MNIQSVMIRFIIDNIPLISIVYIAVGMKLFKQKTDYKVNYFSLLMFAVSIYSFGYFLELNCITLDALLYIRNYEFLGAVFVPSLGFLFIAELTRNKITAWLKWCLMAASMLLWLLFITNPLHHLIYISIDMRVIGGVGIIDAVRGPAFFSMMAYDVLFIIMSSILLFRSWRAEMDFRKKANYLFLLITFQIPWLTVLFIVFGFDSTIDPVPVTIMLMGLFVLINDVKNDVFDLQIKRWEASYANIGEPAFLVDKEGEILCINRNAFLFFNDPRAIVASMAERLPQNIIASDPVNFTINNATRWFDVKKTDFNIRKKLTSYLLIDITEKIREHEALRVSEEKYRLLTENASDVIWVLNLTKEKFTFISPSIFNLRGITVEEAMRETLQDAMTSESLIRVREAIRSHSDLFRNHLSLSDYRMDEIQQPCKNGDLIWVEISSKYRYNEEGDIEIVGVSRNIEERKKAEKEFAYQSYHDQLTGLCNRRYYEENLQLLDTVDHLPMAFLVADVNGLKLINDAFGHKTGDILLKKVGNILRKECRENDIAARIGGDEFILLLSGCGESDVNASIGRINAAIAHEKIHHVILSISIGFAMKRDISENVNEVFKKAEDGMYKNKLYENSSMRSKTINLFMTTLCEKNEREMLHSKRVSEICEAIATWMNFNTNDINRIKLAGLMHDIGKIGIDEKILNKTTKLTDEEQARMEKHAEIGWRILSSVNEFSGIAEYVLAHHERWDGNGYPKSLKGEEIPIGSRIIAIADSYDAMTSPRPYRQVLGKECAGKEIVRCAGTQFDPQIAQIFLEMVVKKEY